MGKKSDAPRTTVIRRGCPGRIPLAVHPVPADRARFFDRTEDTDAAHGDDGKDRTRGTDRGDAAARSRTARVVGLPTGRPRPRRRGGTPAARRAVFAVGRGKPLEV